MLRSHDNGNRYTRMTMSRMVPRPLVGALTGVILLALSAPPTAAYPGPTSAGTNGRLAFGDFPSGIFTINPDGTGKARLVGPKKGYSPVWSPDGTRIAFVRSTVDGSAVFVMSADGTGKRRVTSFQKWIDYATWSPTGGFLLYVRARHGEDVESDEAIIKKVNVDGTGGRRLTEWGSRAYSPALSFDGRKVAYESNIDGDYEIFVMNRNGTGKIKLTSNSVFDGNPEWSRDDTRIAIRRAIERGGREVGTQIVVLDADGTAELAVTDGSRFDVWHSWAPDGSKILFLGEDLGTENFSADLFVVAPDGTGETRLTNTPEFEQVPIWSPDGTKIGYNVDSPDDHATHIYISNADGTDAELVGGTGRAGNYFDWQALP